MKPGLFGMPAETIVEVPPSLRARIEEYLAVRAAEDPAVRAAAPGGAGSSRAPDPVAAYLGVTVVSAKRKAEVAKAGPLDPLNYLELKRLGFGDLVEPIFALGGYVVVSQSLYALGVLGATVSPAPKPSPPPKIELLGAPETPGVALGAALDARMAEASQSRSRVGEGVGEGVGESGAPTAADDGDGAFAVQRRGRRRADAAAAGADMRGMPEAPERYDRVVTKEAKAALKAAALAEAEANKRGPQPLELSLPQRAYAVVGCALLAVGWGHASDEAVLKTLLDPQVRDACQAASPGFLAANLASAVLSVRLAVERQRKVPLWVFKCALSGPLALNELRTLGPVDGSVDPAHGQDEGVPLQP